MFAKNARRVLYLLLMNAPRPWIIAETNWKQVQATRYEVAVLPWGATEAHNWHLPYATDSLQNEAMVTEAGRLAWEAGAKVAVLPNIPFGVQTGQLDIPFCINMNPSTQMAVLEDIISSLEGVGVPKFVIFNGHGGNDFRQMLRELQPRHSRIHLSVVNWFHMDAGKDIFTIVGDHADERETSLVMCLHPELVLPKEEWGDGVDNLPKLKALREKWAWAQRPWTQATNDTGSGDPRHSTAAKGAQYFERLTRKFASYLVELSNVDTGSLYQS
jgi:creatinine amidohydrolase